MTYIVPLSLFFFLSAIFLSKNPVYGVLSFVAVVAHVVLLLINLNLEFLAYTLAIVYIGAIVVLFLFVIMMFYIKENSTTRASFWGLFEYSVLGLLIFFLYANYNFENSLEYQDYSYLVLEESFYSILAYLLFNDFLLLTICAALFMFIGVVGAILLTIKEPLSTRVNAPRVRYAIGEVLKKKL